MRNVVLFVVCVVVMVVVLYGIPMLSAFGAIAQRIATVSGV